MNPKPTNEHYFFEFRRTRSAYIRWALVVLAGIVGGVAGVASIFIAQAMLKLGGSDSADKHGISTNHASRLGGVVVFSFILLSLFWYEFILHEKMLASEQSALLIACGCFFLLGLFEDIKGLLKATVRLNAMLVIMSAFLLIKPEFMLHHTGLTMLDDWALSYAPISFLFTIFGVVFLVNAFNTADGANGLISGVSIMAIIGLIQQALGLTGGVLALVAMGCLIFMSFNVLVGRIFMGDGGAYFLGALMALVLVIVCNRGIESPWYLLCLIFYPHADLLFSMLRRGVAGKSLFGADNGHLHNLIYRKLASITWIGKHANTVTGLSVALVFGVMPLLIWNVIEVVNWFWVYSVQWCVYVVIWQVLNHHNIRDLRFNQLSA